MPPEKRKLDTPNHQNSPYEDKKLKPRTELPSSIERKNDEKRTEGLEVSSAIDKNKQQTSFIHSDDLYLDTINRSVLDFDFEKVCSISLSNLNVYACLICGKYFQGRGKSSHAYTHSLHEDHHVFINMQTLKFYVLPDGYEVLHPSLNDIKYVINPTFTPHLVHQLDHTKKQYLDLSYKKYIPGFVGLNNIKANDYTNVVIQALVHVPPLRDFFLLRTEDFSNELVKRFGLLTRKMWNPRAFKGQVSPHELLQEINNGSGRKFKLTDQGDPMEVLAWLLHFLQSSIFTSTKIDLVHSIFQGTMMVETQKISLLESRKENQMEFDRSLDSTKEIVPYIALALELPPPPLFQDEFERNIIPQVSLTTLLEKYNGTAIRQYGDKLMKFRLQTLPKYLIFHIKRFIKNNWSIEKNPTIVNFSTHNLDMSPFVSDDSIKAKYNILANIVHEGKPEDGQGVYKCHVYHQALEQWFCIQDLRVEEMMPQMVSLGESYIQIWQRSEV